MRNNKKLIVILIIMGIISLTSTRGKNLLKLITHNNISSQTDKFTPTVNIPDNEGIVWRADFETGDLSQWPSYSGERTSHDSGICKRPASGVSEEVAHSGKYSMKMQIDSVFVHPFRRGVRSGCRQFRYAEPRTGETYYYSAWYYLPEHYTINEWAMLGQFKSKEDESAPSDPVWSYRLENDSDGQMRIALRYKADMDGPGKDLKGDIDNRGNTQKTFHQSLLEIPVRKWFHIEILFEQSSEFDGRIILWQDGVELFNLENVKTVYPNSTASWSVTGYGHDFSPRWFTVYIDDAIISTRQIGKTQE